MFRHTGRLITAACGVVALGAAFMAPGGFAAGAVAAAAARPSPDAAAGGSGVAPRMSHCKKGMTSDSDTHFTVWACNNGPGAATDVSAALRLADGMFSPMSSFMGRPPLPDSGGVAGGGSTKIDIYLTGPGQSLRREGETTAAMAVSTASCSEVVASSGVMSVAEPDPGTFQGPGGTKSSGYIVISRLLLDSCTQDFESSLVHEFFHLWSFRDNTTLSCPGFWFQEASATWAQWYFAPQTAAAMVYPYFANDSLVSPGFQETPGVSLTDSRSRRPYDDFVWPLFMQQQAGPGSIASAWHAMNGQRGCDALNAAIDAQVPFGRNFDSFAVENFDYQPVNFAGAQAWPDNFGSKYQDLHPGGGAAPAFPEIPPHLTALETLGIGPYPWTASTAVTLPSLSAQYDLYQAPDVAESIEFDFSALSNPKDLGINIIAADPGTDPSYTRIPVTGSHVRICFAADGAYTSGGPHTGGGRIFVVLDNHHSGGNPATITGSYTVTARTACAASLSGTVKVTQHDTSGPLKITQFASMNMTLATTEASGWTVTAPSSYAAQYKLTEPAGCPGGTQTTQAAGSGAMQPLGDFALSAYQAPYTQPPMTGASALTESGPGTITSPCGSEQITHFLGIVNVNCPPPPVSTSQPGVQGTYAPQDTAVVFSCSGTYTQGSATITNSVRGTLTATDPMPCGLWTAGCSISGTAAPSTGAPQ